MHLSRQQTYKESESFPMAKFLLKRILSAIPTVLIVMVLVFSLMRMIPGSPAEIRLGEDATKEEIEALEEEMGLNDPIYIQFFNYVKGVVTGDWGDSYFNGRSVFENMANRYEPTILIALCSTIITVVIGVPFGVISATHRNTFIDYAITTFSLLFLIVPGFWLGAMMVYLLGFKLAVFPLDGYRFIKDFGLLTSLYHVAMPCMALGLTHVASTCRNTRSAMLDVLNQDYIRTARAKGLSKGKVQYKHALKNVISLIATLIFGSIATMLGGSTMVEKVFNIEGIGKLAYDSLMRRDYSQEQAIVLVMALIYVAMNIFLDIIYKLVDPRVDFGD